MLVRNITDFFVYIRPGIVCRSGHAEELGWKARDYTVRAFEAFRIEVSESAAMWIV
jgi:hypothetical protein